MAFSASASQQNTATSGPAISGGGGVTFGNVSASGGGKIPWLMIGLVAAVLAWLFRGRLKKLFKS